MRKKLAGLTLLALVAGPAIAQDTPTGPSSARTITIAVVQDGPSPGTDIVPMIRQELDALVGGGTTVTYRLAPEYDAAWDGSRVDKALARALEDPEIDIILVTGLLTAEAAVGRELPLPVVSSFPHRADFYRVFDEENDRSLKKNLSFALIPDRTLTDLQTFQEMIPAGVVHVALGREYVDHVKVLEDEVQQFENALGIDIRLLPVTTDVTATLAGLTEGVQGVFLARTPRLDASGRRELIETLNGRGIPTYSHEGHEDVQLGALAARTPEFGRFLARRIALNLSEIIRGVSPSDLPVALPIDASLLINGRTAQQIGYSPGRQFLLSARYLYPEALVAAAQPLSLAEAFDISELNSKALRISTQEIETASQSRELTRSRLYPQLFGSANSEHVKVPGLEGIIPDTTGTAGLQLNQMIYDDRSVSDFKASGRVLDSTREARELERMDVLGDTGRAFYQFVLERALYRVERDNLRLTRENLDLARVRVEAGFSGKDEVFRWESEVAKRESQLILREGEVQAARIALNQVMGIEQDRRWAPVEREIDPEVFPLAGGRLDPYLENMAALALFRDALVKFALDNSPETRVLADRMEALDIQYRQRQRLWYVPVFNLSATYGYDFYRSPELNDVDPDRYVIGVYGTYPLYVGGGRSREIGRVASELATLRQEMDLTGDRVERRTRTAVQRVGSTFPVIRLSRMAAESAEKNFIVVQDKYTQGLVNVTDLLEAQNETFVTDQAAGASVYVFLQDLVELQRAIAWFEDDKTPEQIDEFVQRINLAAAQAESGAAGAGRE
jgi:outer membrane protein TolC